MNDVVSRVKTHVKKHKEGYITGGVFVALAGITVLIVRNQHQCISSSVTGTAGHSVTVTGHNIEIKDNTLNMVSYISSERQGPPSWVVRCVETDQVYTSQRNAAIAMEIAESNISKHLNGLQESAEGYHFVRLCMAA